MDLAPDAQALNQNLIAFRTATAQVVEQPAATRDHLQQTSARMMILRMRRKVFLELQNALAQDRHLHLWRAGIRFMDPELRNDFTFSFSRQCHSKIDTPRLFLNRLRIVKKDNTRAGALKPDLGGMPHPGPATFGAPER